MGSTGSPVFNQWKLRGKVYKSVINTEHTKCEGIKRNSS